jgi:hypothetical protein
MGALRKSALRKLRVLLGAGMSQFYSLQGVDFLYESS